MRKGIMSAALLMLLSVSPLAHAAEELVHAPEDWGEFCYSMLPFADVLKMRLVRPNPPYWNLVAQAEWNGLDVYVLPGGGDWHTDIDEKVYIFNLNLYNTSQFFANQPIVTVRGVVGGPWSLEARGKIGVATYVTQGTIAAVACEDEVVAPSALSRMGMKALAGRQ